MTLQVDPLSHLPACPVEVPVLDRFHRESAGRMRDVLDDLADPHELQIVRSAEDDVQVVEAAGELDANSAARLRGALDEVFAAGHRSVVVDLEGITFIDSSGLSVLIYAYKQSTEREGRLTLRSPSATVVRLLDMTGQSERFLSPGT